MVLLVLLVLVLDTGTWEMLLLTSICSVYLL
jgi:hypothetical protein